MIRSNKAFLEFIRSKQQYTPHTFKFGILIFELVFKMLSQTSSIEAQVPQTLHATYAKNQANHQQYPHNNKFKLKIMLLVILTNLLNI